MASFYKNQSLSDFQQFVGLIYSLPDDRLFSLSELVDNLERFTMRALKGIRKENQLKIKENLLISLSWCATICNRLHFNIEDALWKRFPYACSYCRQGPCVCKKDKIIERVKLVRNNDRKPETLANLQTMFESIYPSNSRTLSDAGVHLAEESGEVSEAVLTFKGQHTQRQFENLQDELADYVSCLFGVANSASLNLAAELEKFYVKNCHVCHSLPCSCNFTNITQYKS